MNVDAIRLALQAGANRLSEQSQGQDQSVLEAWFALPIPMREALCGLALAQADVKRAQVTAASLVQTKQFEKFFEDLETLAKSAEAFAPEQPVPAPAPPVSGSVMSDDDAFVYEADGKRVTYAKLIEDAVDAGDYAKVQNLVTDLPGYLASELKSRGIAEPTIADWPPLMRETYHAARLWLIAQSEKIADSENAR